MGVIDWLRRFAGGGPASAAPAPARFRTEAAAISDVGVVRTENEDRTLLAMQPLEPECGPGDRVSLVALADGMGGHQAGEVASELALETARRVLRENASAAPARALEMALVAANAEVHAESQRRPDRQGMGTTLVLLLLTPAGAFYAWVGDSRLYVLHEGSLRQLGEDDTLVRYMVNDGTITEEQARTHPERNVLAQALGTRARIQRLHVEGPVPIVAGDVFMLCSDGLHDVVDAGRIAQQMAIRPAALACRQLIEEAKRCGSDDNISVAMVRIVDPADVDVGASASSAPPPRPTVVPEAST